jgi:hypothetical protein
MVWSRVSSSSASMGRVLPASARVHGGRVAGGFGFEGGGRDVAQREPGLAEPVLGHRHAEGGEPAVAPGQQGRFAGSGLGIGVHGAE